MHRSKAIILFFIAISAHANSPILVAADKPSLSGEELIHSIEAAYLKGEYDALLESLDQDYQKNTENGRVTPTEEELLFWDGIYLKNQRNKRALLEELELFSLENPSCSTQKIVHEFLSFSLTEQERADLLFITHSLEAYPINMVDRAPDYYEIWLGIKQIAHMFKVKHAILNARIIASDYYTPDDIKAHHIAVDLSTRDALMTFVFEDQLLREQVERSFAAYIKYLAYEYNFYYIHSLLDGEVNHASERERAIKQLIARFMEEAKKIRADQLHFIGRLGAGVFPE
jgi:hypothetical protein